MIHPERLTASIEGDFVVFLIGMRINSPLKIHKRLPVAQAMPRMIKELYRQPSWASSMPRCGSLERSFRFNTGARWSNCWPTRRTSKPSTCLPGVAFNKSVGTDGSVGIWHETYAASPGTYESVYVNMPAFGLGRAGILRPATGGKQFASGRLKADEDAR